MFENRVITEQNFSFKKALLQTKQYLTSNTLYPKIYKL